MNTCKTCGEPCKKRFCNRQCSGQSRLNRVIVPCAYCDVDVSVIPSRISKAEAITCTYTCKESYRAQQQLAHFWDNVDQSGGPDACWPWMGGRLIGKLNYGRFHLGSKTYRAHRMAFILVNGPLVGDEQALHQCDNPPCTNPSHLFKGTNLDNISDRDAKGRQSTGDHVPPENRPRGTKHHNAKLTETTARECYALKGTMSQEKAGAIFGIDQTVVSDLWNRKIWRHIHNVQDDAVTVTN